MDKESLKRGLSEALITLVAVPMAMVIGVVGFLFMVVFLLVIWPVLPVYMFFSNIDKAETNDDRPKDC